VAEQRCPLRVIRVVLPVSGMSAFPPIATEQATWLDVGQAPGADTHLRYYDDAIIREAPFPASE